MKEKSSRGGSSRHQKSKAPATPVRRKATKQAPPPKPTGKKKKKPAAVAPVKKTRKKTTPVQPPPKKTRTPAPVPVKKVRKTPVPVPEPVKKPTPHRKSVPLSHHPVYQALTRPGGVSYPQAPAKPPVSKRETIEEMKPKKQVPAAQHPLINITEWVQKRLNDAEHRAYTRRALRSNVSLQAALMRDIVALFNIRDGAAQALINATK